MNREFDTFGLVLRMRSMVYSSKDFESLWFLYQAEGPSEVTDNVASLVEEFSINDSHLTNVVLSVCRARAVSIRD